MRERERGVSSWGPTISVPCVAAVYPYSFLAFFRIIIDKMGSQQQQQWETMTIESDPFLSFLLPYRGRLVVVVVGRLVAPFWLLYWHRVAISDIAELLWIQTRWLSVLVSRFSRSSIGVCVSPSWISVPAKMFQPSAPFIDVGSIETSRSVCW